MLSIAPSLLYIRRLEGELDQPYVYVPLKAHRETQGIYTRYYFYANVGLVHSKYCPIKTHTKKLLAV